MSKSGIREKMNREREECETETIRARVYECSCMHACVRVHLTAPLRACTCFPACTMCVLHVAQLCQQY